jgi:hypothetical protein
MKRIIHIFFFVFAFTNIFFGQTTPEERRTVEIERERKDTAQKLGHLENQRPPLPKTERFYGKITKEQRKRITPTEADVLKYKQFLKLPGTSIVKILPNPKCNAMVVNADDLKCTQALPIIGMGSRYSFSKETHSDLLRSDISFSDNNFSVGFLSNLTGIIVDLGDADINSITLNTKEIEILTSLSPTRRYSEITMQKQQLEKGFDSKGKRYTTKSLVKLNNTYALRSINYYKVKYYRLIDFYDDITLIFKVINIDSDGSVTLIWKELKKDFKVQVSR